MAEPILVGVPAATGVRQGDAYEIVSEFVFTAEHNDLACRAFETTNPVHLERGVVPGNLLTGWITERLREWALGQPEFSGSNQVILNRMSSVIFSEPVYIGRPMKLVASISDMSPDYLELYVRLSRVGSKRVAMEGLFAGGRILKR